MYKSEKAKKEFELIPDGTYLGIVESIEEKPNMSGDAKILEIKWRLPSINRIFFDHINKDKNFPNDYNHWKVGNILFGCNCPDVDGTSELIKALKGKKSNLTIGHQFFDKTQKDYNQINDYSKVTDDKASTEEEIDDKDLPF